MSTRRPISFNPEQWRQAIEKTKDGTPERARALASMGDLLLSRKNDGEARQLTEQSNLVRAARWILDHGPRYVIIKKGEHGAILSSRGQGMFVSPAYPLHRVVDPEDQDRSKADDVLGRALPLLQEAAGAPVEGMVGVAEPLAAIQDAINLHGFDEIIISMLPKRISKWLRLDLPHKAAGLGLPVTAVTAEKVERIPVRA